MLPPRRPRLKQLIKGPRRPYRILYGFPPDFFCKICIFCSSYTVFSIIERQETCRYGKRRISGTKPAVYQVSRKKACIGPELAPIFFELRVHHKKVRFVVFASRKAMPVFWSLCSPQTVVCCHVLTLAHRYNAVRGHRTGSNNSGAENYLRRKTYENRR